MKFAGRKLVLFIIICLGLALAPLAAVYAQGDSAQGGVFEDFEVAPGERVEVPVEIRDVTDLYAVDLEIRFDPGIIQIEDANPNVEGIQPALGTFLDAGLSLFNTVDNDQGILRFVMTQVNPSEPKSGDGILLVLYVVGAEEGQTNLEVTTLEFSDRFGEAIPVTTVDGVVTVSEEAEESQSTPIPIQDPTEIVPVPTQGPTDVQPTPTMTAAAPTSTPTTVPPTPTGTSPAATSTSTEAPLATTATSSSAPTQAVTEVPQTATATAAKATETPTDVPSTATATSVPPTLTPTGAATTASQIESEPTAEEDQSVYLPVVESAEEQEEAPGEGLMLLDYWWIVLIVVVAVIAAAVYLLVSKK